MKRFLIGMLVLAISGVLFAQASAFSWTGSVRTNVPIFGSESWKVDEGSEDPDSRSQVKFYPMLQGNSRIGFKYEPADSQLTGKFELGAFTTAKTESGDKVSVPDLRLLYGRYEYEWFSLLAGKDYDGTNMLADQTFGTDLGLKGYGAIDGGRNAQVKIGFLKDQLYLALIETNTKTALKILDTNTPDVSEGLNPMLKVNAGWKSAAGGDINYHVTGMMQYYSYDEDFAQIDTSVLSILGAGKFDMNITKDFKFGLHAYYGINMANMGFDADKPYTMNDTMKDAKAEQGAGIVKSDPDPEDMGYDVVNVTSVGGYLTVGYNFEDMLGFNLGLNLGVGYAETQLDEYDDPADPTKTITSPADNRWAMYVQVPYKAKGKFTVTPEFGMFNENGKEEIANMYFGAQLKYDF